MVKIMFRNYLELSSVSLEYFVRIFFELSLFSIFFILLGNTFQNSADLY